LAVYLLVEPVRADQGWPSTVELWAAGLDSGAWSAQIRSLAFIDGEVCPYASDAPPELTWALAARLAGDDARASREQRGAAIAQGVTYEDHRDWSGSMLSWLIPATAEKGCRIFLTPPPPGTSEHEVAGVAVAISTLLRTQAGRLPSHFIDKCIDLIVRYTVDFKWDKRLLLTLLYVYPQVFARHPSLHKREFFATASQELRYVLIQGGRLRVPRWDDVMARLGEPEPGVDPFAAVALLRTLMVGGEPSSMPEMPGEEGSDLVADEGD
jgi:hypothetical protein